jgi:hypothetical protein
MRVRRQSTGRLAAKPSRLISSAPVDGGSAERALHGGRLDPASRRHQVVSIDDEFDHAETAGLILTRNDGQ